MEKIDEKKLEKLRALYESNMSRKEIAKQFGVSETTVYRWIKKFKIKKPEKKGKTSAELRININIHASLEDIKKFIKKYLGIKKQ